MKPLKNKRLIFLTLCLITVMGLLIRLAYIANTEINYPIRVDARQYLIYGHNIYHYGVFSKDFPSDKPRPDSFRSPGYPLFLSFFFFLDKGNKEYYHKILYTQAILSTVLIPLTFFMGIRFLSLFWSFIAACFVAFSPHLISVNSYILTESLFAIFLLTALFALSQADGKKQKTLFILSGIFFGIAYLINETALFLPYLIFFTYMICFRQSLKESSAKRLVINMIFFICIFSLFPVSWKLRNIINLPPGASQGSDRALATITHGTYPGFIYKSEKYKYLPYKEDPMQPAFSSSFENFIPIFWERYKERPLRYLSWYFFEKPYYLWSWNILQGQGDVYIYPVITSLYQVSKSANITREIMKFLHPVILVFSLFGVVLFIHKIFREKTGLSAEYPVFVLFIIIVYYTFLYTIFAPWPRYSIPLRPELYLFAIWSLYNISIQIKKKYLHTEKQLVPCPD